MSVNNTKYGSASLNNNSGSNNTAIGAYAAYNNLDGTNNTAIGSNSSFFNTTGANNTALGAGSLCNNETGSLLLSGITITVTAGQYIEVWFSGDSTAVSLPAFAAGVTPTRPATSSVLLTMIKLHP
jgi:hypothetical protein